MSEYIYAKQEQLDRLQYYGDANIVPSDASLFEFETDDETMTAIVYVPDSWIVNEVDYNDIREIIIPYEYKKNGKTYSVTKIDPNWLSMSVGTQSILIPESVTNIDVGAFYNFTSLKFITIPKYVTTIGDGAFQDCFDLTDVYFRGTKEQWDVIKIGENNDALLNATIHYEYTDVTKEYVDEKIGDIDSALEELHNYAQALIGGAE